MQFKVNVFLLFSSVFLKNRSFLYSYLSASIGGSLAAIFDGAYPEITPTMNANKKPKIPIIGFIDVGRPNKFVERPIA
jgi:hypothetical protein